jgi:hypothetical protein
MLANQTNQVKLVMILKKEGVVIIHFQYLVEVVMSFNPKKVEEVEYH